MLSIKSISKKFNQHIVLDDLSLEIPKGDIAIFLGGSGVGKSTLLRILSNLENADTGTVLLDGTALKTSCHSVGMVFQQFNLFNHITVTENITLALINVLRISPQEALRTAHELLKKYELFSLKDKYPMQLSGGQKQRLAIARALALNPRVLCLDEPTSALDPLLTTHVAHTIQELSQLGYTIAIATHDTALLEHLNATIYLMRDGKIIQSAHTKEFMHNKESYRLINDFVSGKRNSS